MTNNDIFRRLRYILNFKDTKIIKVLSLINYPVHLERVVSWLKKEEHENFIRCTDRDLIAFLDGLIIEKRGVQDNAKPVKAQETSVNNNLILLKIKIDFNFKSNDMLDVLKLAGYNISSSELSAFFRKKTHRHFRVCQDQLLRKFLKGLQIKYTTPAGLTKPKISKSEPKKLTGTLSMSTRKVANKTPNKKPTKFSW